MDHPFDVHAPGKLVLLGEYAVLDGAPALVLAVHRGVGCTVEPGGDGVELLTPGDDRFARAGLDAVRAPPGRYRFYDLDPLALEGKPGFGGSAAAAVAAVIAGGGLGPEAFAVHHRVQGGGSGVDVAASLHGGLIRFEGGKARPLAAVEPAVVFSGRSASTGPRVRTYRAWSGDRDAFVTASRALVDAFPRDPVGVFERAGALLARMAHDAGIDYLTPGLQQIATLAREHGGAAKPSGAGGGDCAVALFYDQQTRRDFELACRARGFFVIPVRSAPGAARLPAESGGLRD